MQRATQIVYLFDVLSTVFMIYTSEEMGRKYVNEY